MFGKTACILFSGKAGTGKTTSADFCISEYSEVLNMIKGSFAFGVKETARKSFYWNGKKDQLGRRLLQGVGRIGREYNKNIWVSKLIDEYIVGQKDYPFDVLLVDDWRYPNEVDYIRNDGMYNVYTVRLEAPEREILKGTPEYNDSSEVELDDYDFDYIIDNSGDIKNLHNSLRTLMSNIILENTFGGI